MSKLASLVLAGSVAAALLAVPRDALACWDGISASTKRVSIVEISEPTWSPVRVRDYATWMRRTEALLPEDHTVDAPDPRTVTLEGPDEDSNDDDTYVNVNWGDPEGVFEAVAKLTKTKRSKRRRALAIQTEVFTVQIGALADAAKAEELAERTRHAKAADEGFFHVENGYPYAGYAHVLKERARGRVLHKVLSGSFLDEREARVVATKLGRELGVKAFVRKL